MRNAWNRATENLYSAWIEKMFDAPLDAELSWPTLHDVLRDKSRNMLFNYLGLGEDEIGDLVPPRLRRRWFISCAPISPSRWVCRSVTRTARAAAAASRRSATAGSPISIAASASKQSMASSFGAYLPVVADAVQSGAVRTLGSDDNTDFYTVPLTQETLRPGTVYADPYGHVLMLVHRVPEANGASGVFFAVDGEPDGTVARKRFWRGNFLFAHLPALEGPGFKHFRPIARDASGNLRRLTNAEIAKDPQYGDFSLEQSQLSVDDFYDRMDDGDVAAAARSGSRDEGRDHLARGAGKDSRRLGRERP